MLVKPEDLVEQIYEAYVEVDSGLRIRAMNENAEILLRKNRSEAIGRTFDEVIADAARSQHWASFVEAVKSGQAQTISIFYPVRYKWHEVKIIPVGNGQAGLLMRDVTHRQWLIRREAERVYLSNLFEHSPVALSLLRGGSLEVEYVNAFGRQLIGNRNILGRPIREAFPDVEQRELFTILEKVFTQGEPFSSRDVFVRYDRNNDGIMEEAFFDVMYHPVGDFDGKISGVLCLSIEVTDRLRPARQAMA